MKKSWNKIKNILKIWLLSILCFSFLLWWISYGVDDLLYQLMYPAISSDTVIDMWESVNTVWENFFEWSFDIDLLDVDTDLRFAIGEVVRDDDGNPLCGRGGKKKIRPCPEECQVVNEDNKKKCWKEWRYKFMEASYIEASGGISRNSSIIVKFTRILLSLVITLSVTMILWNWMSYIIQTWQWKEWKNLVKNIVYIVVWILIALFSVIIITIIQSVPATLDDSDEGLVTDTDNSIDRNALQDNEPLAGWVAGVSDESWHYTDRF